MPTIDLLTPRFKVIADYIGNNVEVGTIFTSDIGEYYEKFPANFKRLEWWEERKLEEMPEYVKQEGLVDSKGRPVPKRILKIRTHFTSDENNWRSGNVKCFTSDDSKTHLYSEMYHDFLPATIEEYIDCHKSLKQQ